MVLSPTWRMRIYPTLNNMNAFTIWIKPVKVFRSFINGGYAVSIHLDPQNPHEWIGLEKSGSFASHEIGKSSATPWNKFPVFRGLYEIDSKS